ncbi:hypothetical protein [Suipraeoptans intestinalis]|uniref:hypothetical protein n=1 Tax=Suipraeoptans intestinalis TaxID=2606628 RepID=UPI0023F4520B|nr:hypothetical protein [Suipraeoptans intestinalis]MDD7769739.1 hypothetical protein [Suipraeoptans intestinalis]MDY3121239.1 hypothetical protein [Suipraeoptans intestinalis]
MKQIKRCLWWAVLILCLILPVACSQKKETEQKDSAKQTKKEWKDREKVEAGVFTVYYPKGWKYDKEELKKEKGYGNLLLYDGSTREESDVRIRITGEKEEAITFRKKLAEWKVDLREYADGKVKGISSGNAEFARASSEQNDTDVYLYRHEKTGVSYRIEVSGDKENKKVKKLIEGIVISDKGEKNKEAPWPWDGKAFQPKLSEQMVGSYTIQPEYIPFDGKEGTQEIMKHKFVHQNGKLFHLLGNKLTTYEYKEKGLVKEDSLELETDYEYLSTDNSGMLYVAQGVFEVIGIKDGKQAMQTTIKGDLNMHPSGEWGISFWVNSDPMKVTNKSGVLTAEPWILSGLNDDANRQGPFQMLDDVQITENYIMVAGKKKAADSDETETKIIVYDYEGNQVVELGGEQSSDPDRLGYITGMAETENGFVATDGNMRRIHFWAKDGTSVGSIETSKIFGTSYPWLEDMQKLEDGSLLLLVTQEREDGSANELMLFRLTGF